MYFWEFPNVNYLERDEELSVIALFVRCFLEVLCQPRETNIVPTYRSRSGSIPCWGLRHQTALCTRLNVSNDLHNIKIWPYDLFVLLPHLNLPQYLRLTSNPYEYPFCFSLTYQRRHGGHGRRSWCCTQYWFARLPQPHILHGSWVLPSSGWHCQC